jgi:hypothetical protein
VLLVQADLLLGDLIHSNKQLSLKFVYGFLQDSGQVHARGVDLGDELVRNDEQHVEDAGFCILAAQVYFFQKTQEHKPLRSPDRVSKV